MYMMVPYLWNLMVHFTIFEAMRYPSDINYVFAIDVIDPMVQQLFELNAEDELMVVVTTT